MASRAICEIHSRSASRGGENQWPDPAGTVHLPANGIFKRIERRPNPETLMHPIVVLGFYYPMIAMGFQHHFRSSHKIAWWPVPKLSNEAPALPLDTCCFL